jgi:hypothetical protein
MVLTFGRNIGLVWRMMRSLKPLRGHGAHAESGQWQAFLRGEAATARIYQRLVSNGRRAPFLPICPIFAKIERLIVA